MDDSQATKLAEIDEQLDAPESIASVEEARWRAGVNRQARPDALAHQVAAAQALCSKRKDAAMSKEERDARRNAGKRARRADAKAREHAASSAAAAAEVEAEVADAVAGLLDSVVLHAKLDALGSDERDRFETWLCSGAEPTLDDFTDWRGSHEYECWHAERCAEQWVESDAQYDARLAKEEQRRVEQEAQRQHELEHGAAYEWVSCDGRRWKLLPREVLAGRRDRYDKLLPFDGSLDEAARHLHPMLWQDVCGLSYSDLNRLTVNGYSAHLEEPDDADAFSERVRAAREWIEAQRELFLDAQRRRLRWKKASGFVKLVDADDADVSTVATHYGSPSSGPLHGGTVVGAPSVRGGVHEYTFTIDEIHDRAPQIGIWGERQRVRGGTTTWLCMLDLSDGYVYYDGEKFEQRLLGDLSQVVPGCTVTVRVHFLQRRLGFSLNGEQMVWYQEDALRYCGDGFRPVSAKPCAKFHTVYGDARHVDIEHGTTVTLSAHATLVAAPDMVVKRRAKGSSQLIMAVDPEGEVPYFYFDGDIERRLAQQYGCLEMAAEAPSWLADAPAKEAEAFPDAPKRAQYPLGDEGRRRFREARAKWYRARVGRDLQGCVSEQVRLAHNAARFERTRSKA